MPREVEWLPQEAITRMQEALADHTELTRAQLSDHILEQCAPMAAHSVVDLAIGAEDESVRLNAAKYVLDRSLGKPQTRVYVDTSPDNPVSTILEGVVVDREPVSAGTTTPTASYQDGDVDYIEPD